MYAPVKQSQLCMIAPGVTIDHGRIVEWFFKDSTVTIDGALHAVVESTTIQGLWELCPVEEGVLDVLKGMLRKPFGSLFSAAKEVVINHPIRNLTDEDSRAMRWCARGGALEDPAHIAMYGKLRMRAAENLKGSIDPDDAVRVVSSLPRVKLHDATVEGPFRWGGYCYSCASPLPVKGKLTGRICKSCTAKNGNIARLVADGLEVASEACPAVYPGVVWTRTRHPALKEGIETVADSKNFRLAPTPLTHCGLIPSNVPVHVSVGSV